LLLSPAASPTDATAATRAGDRSASLAYLRALRVFFRQIEAGLPAGAVAADGFVGQLGAECPGVATGAPEGTALTEFDIESVEATAIVLLFNGHTAVRTFVGRVAHLRWSDRRLTRLVRRFAHSDEEELTTGAPPLCAQLREWAAAGFGALPASAKASLKRLEGPTPQLSSPEQEIFERLRRYVGARGRPLLRSARKAEEATELSLLKPLTGPVARLQELLGLQRAPAPHSTPPA
jgi:hypothetical protein